MGDIALYKSWLAVAALFENERAFVRTINSLELHWHSMQINHCHLVYQKTVNIMLSFVESYLLTYALLYVERFYSPSWRAIKITLYCM